MKKFKDLRESVLQYFFLAEASSSNSLAGNINDKGTRHFKNYVAAKLPKHQIATSEKAFGTHVKAGGFGSAEHGASYDPKANYTHTLAKAHGAHPAGTQVKVTGGHIDETGRIHVSTEKHGTIPQSKIEKPKDLAKPAATKGFSVEHKLASNIGGVAKGATAGTDVEANITSGKKTHAVKTNVATTQEKPNVRIESKLDRGKMGEATIKHTAEKGWHISERSPNKAIGESHLRHATYENPGHPDHGMKVLDFLNKHHSAGTIDKTHYFKAAPGTAKAYTEHTGANYLHIHDVNTDKGTTYGLGANHEMKGKTNLGHMSNATLNGLDHMVEVKPTTTGTSTMVHRPKRSTMKKLAAASTENPTQHGDLSNPEHANTFVSKVKSALGK
jgi:hypothetical protein